jgi:hypothetical protein
VCDQFPHLSADGSHGKLLKRVHFNRPRLQAAHQLLVRGCANPRGDNRAAGGPRDHPRQQAAFIQRANDAEMVHGQRRAAREKQGGAAERVASLTEKHKLLHERERREVVVGQVPQLVHHFIDVILDTVASVVQQPLPVWPTRVLVRTWINTFVPMCVWLYNAGLHMPPMLRWRPSRRLYAMSAASNPRRNCRNPSSRDRSRL